MGLRSTVIRVNLHRARQSFESLVISSICHHKYRSGFNTIVVRIDVMAGRSAERA